MDLTEFQPVPFLEHHSEAAEAEEAEEEAAPRPSGFRPAASTPSRRAPWGVGRPRASTNVVGESLPYADRGAATAHGPRAAASSGYLEEERPDERGELSGR